MPKCDACRADGAKLRCHKCQGCWSCDKACAKRFWRTHKKFCTDDPALKRHVPIELAVERALAKEPKTEVPPNATCYICLEVEGPLQNGDKVTRACACRGPSAGFAHVDCLEEMASRNPWIVVGGGERRSRWMSCPTCHSAYVSALRIDMARRCWRLERDNPYSVSTQRAHEKMSILLRESEEPEAADRLEDAIRGVTTADPYAILRLDLLRAHGLTAAKRHDDALEFLTSLRPRMERHGDLKLRYAYADTMASALAAVGRLQEAIPFAVEAVERSTETYGPDSGGVLRSRYVHAQILAGLGRVGDATAILARVLATRTRVLGADHPETLETRQFLDDLSA